MDTRSMEHNVICVKWGDKFSAEHVNRLYRMAKGNISLPFTFYCYTDDPTGIDTHVVTMQLQTGLEVWWNKMYLFDENHMMGINLFLDLDVVIQKNIDNLFEKAVHNKLTLIDRSVFDTVQEYMYNSSIMVWYANEMLDLYTKFSGMPDTWTSLYGGIDRFFTHEFSKDQFNNIGTDVYYFRREVTNLFTYRDDQQYSIGHNGVSHRVYHDKSKQICVFNQSHESYFYKNMEDYFL